MSYIVCGWYTPDYQGWVAPLLASLDAVGAPHDFLPVDKRPGGWERNTLRKPAMILQAMRRHQERTIIFLDVDAVVHGPLHDLAAIHGDIGLHMRGKVSRTGRLRMGMRSGTMVLRRTEPAASFLRRWAELSEHAAPSTVDQTTLSLALVSTPGLTVTNLSIRFCATAADRVEDPIIAHDRASSPKNWMSRTLRAASRVSRFRPICGARSPGATEL